MMAWVAAGLVIAMGGFTAYRLIRSWGTARSKLDAIDSDPPRPGSA